MKIISSLMQKAYWFRVKAMCPHRRVFELAVLLYVLLSGCGEIVATVSRPPLRFDRLAFAQDGYPLFVAREFIRTASAAKLTLPKVAEAFSSVKEFESLTLQMFRFKISVSFFISEKIRMLK